MNKIIILLSFVFIFIGKTFASIGNDQINQTEEHVSFISKILSPELFLNIFLATIIVLITFGISKIITYRLESYIENKSNGEGREELLGVLKRVSNITILTLGGMIALGILGVNMGIFMGGLGFGLGFTLKIFLSNFIAGIIMVTQGTYHNKDLVEIEGKIGIIKKINSLFTEIEQFDGVIFYVPNIKFLENNVKNYYKNDRRRIEINIGVDYDTNILKAKKIILQLINTFPDILKTPKLDIYITEFNDNAINISIRFWINSKNGYFKIKSNVIETINLAFKQAGIVIPFPQITLSNRDSFKISKNK